jgi:hypothetical protein
MKLLKAIAGISALLLLGAAAGSLGTGLFVKNRIETFREKGPPPITPLVMERLGRHLELNPEQRQAVKNILEDAQQDLGRLRQEFRPRVSAIFSECFRRIESELTPIQQKRFQRVKNRFPRFLRPIHRRGPGGTGAHTPGQQGVLRR